jgi:hypothetical protein
MKMSDQKFCQSCGMPLETLDIMGTNADQSKNEDYCIYCFKDGGFTKDVTMDEMISISLEHMKEMFGQNPDFDEQEALNNMRSFFPVLKRWKA